MELRVVIRWAIWRSRRGHNTINAPELASFFVEKPAFLLGCFDDASGKKRTVVLIGSRTVPEPVKEITNTSH